MVVGGCVEVHTIDKEGDIKKMIFILMHISITFRGTAYLLV